MRLLVSLCAHAEVFMTPMIRLPVQSLGMQRRDGDLEITRTMLPHAEAARFSKETLD